MKPRTLYVKILLAFLGVLIVTEAVILALFIATAGRTFKRRIDEQSIAKLMIFKETVQEKINNFPHRSVEENEDFTIFLTTFSQLFDLKIWVTLPDETVVFKTFSADSPFSMDGHFHKNVVKNGIRLYHLSRRHLSYYANMNIKNHGQHYTLHLHLDKQHAKKPEAPFFIGLAIIGGIIALLVIPLSRLITRRIAQLNASALEFAAGNLGTRTHIKGRDEIAGLGRTFNFMADRLEKMIQGQKEMMANLSHELRSPLTRIRMSKELIRERLNTIPDTEAVGRYADHIDRDIDTLDHLIDQILKLSKMDFQTPAESIERIDLAVFFKGVERRFAPALLHRHLTMEKDFQDGITIEADQQDLDTILSNLVDNAVKYCNDSGRIRVTAETREEDVVFSIANSFRPLSPSEIDRFFQPFFRGDKTGSGGSGLGLTIIEKLVKKSGAAISARSSNADLIFELRFKR